MTQPINQIPTLRARFMGPTWGPSGADRTQVGPMLAPWILLSGDAPPHVNISFCLFPGVWLYDRVYFLYVNYKEKQKSHFIHKLYSWSSLQGQLPYNPFQQDNRLHFSNISGPLSYFPRTCLFFIFTSTGLTHEFHQGCRIPYKIIVL